MTIKKNENQNKSPRAYNPYWLYAIMFVFIISFYFRNSMSNEKEISWLHFDRDMLSQHDVEKILIINKETAEIYIKQDRLAEEKYKDIPETGPQYKMEIGSIDNFERKLHEAQQNFAPNEKVEVRYENRVGWGSVLSWLLPFGLILLFWVFIIRRMGAGGMGKSMFNFGKSTAKLSDMDTRSKVTFDDVAGLKEAKVEIMEMADFLKNPEEFTKLGAKIPKGILLVGPLQKY